MRTRRVRKRSMIGSLLFYVLSPLSRYLPGALTGAPETSSQPTAVHGSAETNGAAVATKKFTQSETAPSDQEPRGATAGPGGEMEDPEKPGPEGGPPGTLLQEVPEPAAVTTQTGECSAVSVDETEGMHGHLQEGGDTPTLCVMQRNVPEGESIPSMDMNPEKVLLTLLKCMQTKDSMHETTFAQQRESQAMRSAEALTPAASQITGRTHPPVMEEQHTGLTELWDENKPAATVQTHNSDAKTAGGEQCDAQSCWHFSAGPGLREEVRCPLWEFPAASYYPASDATAPLEVVWREWEDVSEDAAAAEPSLKPLRFKTASIDFTLMSYNILAQDLLEDNQELYTHCPLEVLDWSYRCSVLLEEVKKWSPDILCLQEVQENHYEEELRPALSQLGYKCVFKRRTGTKTDGCATCYRSSRFSEEAASPLEFFRPETELLDRHNVGVVLLLRPTAARGQSARGRGPPLCVANTHLLFNPRRGDVKLAQVAIVLAEVDRVVKSCAATGERCSVILCGDFNAVPHSGLYQLITTGELLYQHFPLWMVSGQEDLSYKMHCHRLSAPLWPRTLGINENCQYIPVEPIRDQNSDPSSGHQPHYKRFRPRLSHGLDLQSVYEHTLPGSGNAEVTTLHSETGATVDYIFYSPERDVASQQKGAVASGGLKLTGRLSLLSEDVLWSMHGLPNHEFPSDHLSLLAKFKLDVTA